MKIEVTISDDEGKVIDRLVWDDETEAWRLVHRDAIMLKHLAAKKIERTYDASGVSQPRPPE